VIPPWAATLTSPPPVVLTPVSPPSVAPPMFSACVGESRNTPPDCEAASTLVTASRSGEPLAPTPPPPPAPPPPHPAPPPLRRAADVPAAGGAHAGEPAERRPADVQRLRRRIEEHAPRLRGRLHVGHGQPQRRAARPDPAAPARAAHLERRRARRDQRHAVG